jgi:hypothetical protein
VKILFQICFLKPTCTTSTLWQRGFLFDLQAVLRYMFLFL